MGKFRDQGNPALALAEECSEVIKVITKLQRFEGTWDEIPPGEQVSRWAMLCSEMEDVMYQFRRLEREVMSLQKTKVYSVYHPIGGSMNHDCQPATYMYEHICNVKATSLEDAFKQCQNDFSEDYASLGKRSTSVGDIIQCMDDHEVGQCHLIKGRGFQTVTNHWLSFIDWGEIMPDPATLADLEQEMRNQH